MGALFRCLPLCLGHVDQMPPGSALACDIPGLSPQLVRAEDGECMRFSVPAGIAVQRRLTAPCDPAIHGLLELLSCVQNGLIWAILDPQSGESPRHRSLPGWAER
jgi:hypothetical protein